MLATLVSAAWVTVAPTASDQCPSSAHVQAAIEAHAPNLLSAFPDPAIAGPLTLSLDNNPSSGELSLSLADRTGAVKLQRTLPPPADRVRDCAALADTVALIVERYFNEVELPALPEKKVPPPEPAAPPPVPRPSATEGPPMPFPRFALSGTVGRRVPGAGSDLGGIEFKLTFGAALVRFGQHRGALWTDLAAGIVGIANHDEPHGRGRVTAVRTGADLAVMLAWSAWHGRFFVGPQATVDLLRLTANYGSTTQTETHLGATAGLRLGYHLAWQRFFFRLDASACGAIVRQRVVVGREENPAIFAAPAAYVTVAGGVGVSF